MAKETKFSFETTGGTVTTTIRQTSDGSTVVIEKGPGYYRSIHENQKSDRDVCVHDHNPDGSEDKTWYDKSGNFKKTEHY